MSNIEIFKEENPTLESYWRSIILFGRNVASYKFALAKSLLEIVPSGQTKITLEELAKPFSRNICEHIKKAPKQATSNTSQFLESCKGFNGQSVSYEQLIDITVKRGFNNVIDAFHVVNDGTIPVSFYNKDYSRGNKQIILTDEIFKLQDGVYFDNFMHETESRWNLVETAWEMGISRNLLNINYDDKNKLLFIDDKLRRKDVTSARDALNGYQKGKCFYCYDDISVLTGDDMLCDVDHFFPHILQSQIPELDLNGVWNLVLACPNCNRGAAGKFALVPEVEYLERLHKRNEYLICSHHPLRETLMYQTGQSVEERITFLKKMDNKAINNLVHRWGTEQIGDETF